MTTTAVIKFPLAAESATKKVEEDTLVFVVDAWASTHQLTQAVKELCGVDVAKVNTVIRPDGEKAAPGDALGVANKIGII